MFQEELSQIIDESREKIQRKLSKIQIDDSHFNMYSLIGINKDEAYEMELQHRRQRIISSNLGRLIEKLIFKTMETVGATPNFSIGRFKIDMHYEDQALEVKLRETTTDGDHFHKEKQKVALCLKKHLKPIRLVMYESPESVMKKYRDIYEEGDLYHAQEAWDFITQESGFNLLNFILRNGIQANPDKFAVAS